MTKLSGWKIGKVSTLDDGQWLWLASSNYLAWKFTKDNSMLIEITGKYLFFHPDPKILTKIAKDEIISGGFHLAKISKELAGNNHNHVLCLYYKDDSRKNELATKYQDKNDIQYRYWKSDEDTRNGKYSKQFLSRL